MYCHLLLRPGSCMLTSELHHKCGKNVFITLEASPRAATSPHPPTAPLPLSSSLPRLVGSCFRQPIDVARAAQWSQGRSEAGVTGCPPPPTPPPNPDHRSHRSAGGTIHLYLPLGRACFARTPSLALRGVAGGLADPRGSGSNNPCSPVSKCRSGAAQLRVAAAAVGEPLQALER